MGNSFLVDATSELTKRILTEFPTITVVGLSRDPVKAAHSVPTAMQAYAYGRPRYPVEAVQWALPDGARTVLDLAAGTGKLTQRLLELGLDVIAVEPSDEMRAFVPNEARALAGSAEAIPLSPASVDA